jgi:hypothetical protein
MIRLNRAIGGGGGAEPSILLSAPKDIRRHDALAFFYGDDLIRSDVRQTINLTAGPIDVNGVCLRICSEAESENELA